MRLPTRLAAVHLGPQAGVLGLVQVWVESDVLRLDRLERVEHWSHVITITLEYLIEIHSLRNTFTDARIIDT